MNSLDFVYLKCLICFYFWEVYLLHRAFYFCFQYLKIILPYFKNEVSHHSYFLFLACIVPFFPLAVLKICSLSFISYSLIFCLEFVGLYFQFILENSQPLSLQNKCLPHSLFLCSLSGTPVIHILDDLMSFTKSWLPHSA